MDFKDFFSKEKNNQEFYWALVLEPGLVQAAIWTIIDQKAQVVSTSKPASWREDEELFNTCDVVLSSAVQNFPEDAIEPSKTVFGVSGKWVENGEIKAEYLERIKKICTELSLEPSGFVILPEAIAHLIKSEEGSPLSAVVVAVREENIEISLFKLGNLIGSTSVARSVSLPDDVIEGLTRFKLSETYPSRFLIFDGKEGELEEVKQNLLSYDWEIGEKIKFLHTPKIEIITSDKKVLATALAGASEISDVKKIESLKEEEKEVPLDVENISLPDQLVKPEDLGFVVGEDVVKKSEVSVQTQTEVPVANRPQQPLLQETKVKVSFSDKIKKIIKSLKGAFEKKPEQKNFNGQNKKTFLIGGVVFFLFLVVGFLLWWFLPKAVLTIYVSPKKLKEKITFSVNTGGSTNLSEKVISGKAIEVFKEGEKSKSTTGKKTVGEKARGTVKIQNGTSSPIKLSQGTVIVSGGDLEFALDNSASVSAAVSPSLPGEVNVDVTASVIGAEHNLMKDDVFKVSNYLKSEVDAVALADFSGGSSREISAVSQEDQDELINDLEKELSENAKDEFENKISENEYFIQESIASTMSSKVFSNKVGDEASNLKLSLGINVKGVVVDKTTFFDFIKQSLKEQVPSGYVLRDDQASFGFNSKDIDDNNYSFEVSVEVNLLPQVEFDEILEKIKGKSESVVERFLVTVPGFTRAEIKFIPKLPGKLRTIPHVIKNISIELATER